MASAPVSFSELKVGRNSPSVVARLLRFWEARNVKKGGQLMGVDMLLLDEKSTLMSATINVARLNTFKHLLNKGALYAIGGFDVTRSNLHFKLCDAPTSIRFTEQTSFIEVPETKANIPKELFRFRKYDQLVSLANTNNDLPDIIGEVISVKTILSEETQASQRISVNIRLSSGQSVSLSAFDGLAVKLDEKLQSTGVEPRVILATNINPKSVGGRLFLNATSGTHFYFDLEVEATRTFKAEVEQKTTSPSNAGAKYRRVQKLESVTVAELNDYILKSSPQNVEFLCTAKVIDIQTKNGWSYIACSKCSRKLLRGISSFTCTGCHEHDAVALNRYRVEMVVSNGDNTAVFVGFDTDMTKLTNMSASDAAVTTEEEIPEVISDIVGKTFSFQIKLTEYNFTSNHQSFTITRIYEEKETKPTPTFENQAGGILTETVDVDSVAEHVAHEFNSQSAVVSDTASTSDGRAGQVPETTEEPPAKKARNE